MTDEPLYPKLVRLADSVPSFGKRPYEPPVIESYFPNIDMLPPGVVDEWSRQCLLGPETDEDGRELRLVSVDGGRGIDRVIWRAGA